MLKLTRPGTFRFEICPECEGHGTKDHPAFSNGFTQSEWNDNDEDFQVDYMRGAYDVPCGCEGGRIRMPIVANMTYQEKRALAEQRQHARWKAETDDIYEAERRFGA